MLVNIACRLPDTRDLVSFSLVCRPWALAVAQVPTAMVARIQSLSQGRQLEAWLASRGKQLASLTVASGSSHRYRIIVQLPCSSFTNLQALRMVGIVADFKLAMTPQALPALEQLDMDLCAVNTKTLKRLPVGRCLTCLRLDRMTFTSGGVGSGAVASADDSRPYSDQRESELATAILSILQRLPDLKVLTLTSADWSPAALPSSALTSLSTMQQLREAAFNDQIMSSAALQYLPSGLNRLRLMGPDDHPSRLSLTPTTLPQAGAAAALGGRAQALGTPTTR